jgi:hypothetical protein
MTARDAALGPERFLESLASPSGTEYGRCTGLLFGDVKPENVERILVGEEGALRLRKFLGEMGRLLPVFASGRSVSFLDPHSASDEEEAPAKATAKQRLFQAGDRVATKPHVSDRRAGTILGATPGGITIQWDGGGRTLLGMVEALAYLMEMPRGETPREGMVMYSLPGVSEETVGVLNDSGIDAVTLFSLLSHARPGGKAATGHEALLPRLLGKLGLRASKVSGYGPAPEGSEAAFEPKSWFEARLPRGQRLVIDLAHDKLVMEAGDADDYIPSSPYNDIPLV